MLHNLYALRSWKEQIVVKSHAKVTVVSPEKAAQTRKRLRWILMVEGLLTVLIPLVLLTIDWKIALVTLAAMVLVFWTLVVINHSYTKRHRKELHQHTAARATVMAAQTVNAASSLANALFGDNPKPDPNASTTPAPLGTDE